MFSFDVPFFSVKRYPPTKQNMLKTISVENHINSSLSITNIPEVATSSLIIIDPAIDEPESLRQFITPGIPVVILDPSKDGIIQITEHLQQYPQCNRLHIFSHGAPGRLKLGSTDLSLDTIANYAEQLATWFGPEKANTSSLPTIPTVLLYGCEIALGESGDRFLNMFHRLTGASVFASTTPTGHEASGGNWQLEVSVPQASRPDSLVISPEGMKAYPGRLNLIAVGNSTAVQPDGKIVVVGNAATATPVDGDIFVARYNSDGRSLDDDTDGDAGFSIDGVLIDDIRQGQETATSVTILPDGKILVAGQFNETEDSNGSGGTDRGNGFILLRYTPDGQRDTDALSSDGMSGFDFDGGTVTYFSEGDAIANVILIQPSDNKIVLVGTVANTGGNDFALARYNPDGTDDTTFGINHLVVTALPGNQEANDAVIQANDFVVAAGTSDGDFALARYTTSGTLDSTFGSGGFVTTDLGGDETIESIVQLPDGKFLVAGTIDGNIALARYTSTGTLDTDFGPGDTGFVIQDLGADESVKEILVQSDSTILVAGKSGANVALVKFTSDGALDTSFGSDGILLQPETSTFFVIDPDGLSGGNPIISIEEDKIDEVLEEGGRDPETVRGRQFIQLIGEPLAKPREPRFPKPDETIRSSGREVGTSGNDRMVGSGERDSYKGRKGNDQIILKGGNDKGIGNGGKDKINGGNGNDRLKGGGRIDKLIGGRGNDRLIGQGGADFLNGGAGEDLLVGGGGRDLYIFSNFNHGVDKIRKFAANDAIDLSGVLNGDSFTGTPSEKLIEYVRLLQNGSNTEIWVDSDGNGSGEFSQIATLLGTDASTITALNFVVE